MPVPGDTQFVHRSNYDRSFDSICKLCFRTVISSRTEADLAAGECSHHCDHGTIYFRDLIFSTRIAAASHRH